MFAALSAEMHQLDKKLETTAAALEGKPGLASMNEDLLRISTLSYAAVKHSTEQGRKTAWAALKAELTQQGTTIQLAAKFGWEAARATMENEPGYLHSISNMSKGQAKRLSQHLKEQQQSKQLSKQHQHSSTGGRPHQVGYTGYPPRPQDGCWTCGGDHMSANCPRGRGQGALPGPPPLRWTPKVCKRMCLEDVLSICLLAAVYASSCYGWKTHACTPRATLAELLSSKGCCPVLMHYR